MPGETKIYDRLCPVSYIIYVCTLLFPGNEYIYFLFSNVCSHVQGRHCVLVHAWGIRFYGAMYITSLGLGLKR